MNKDVEDAVVSDHNPNYAVQGNGMSHPHILSRMRSIYTCTLIVLLLNGGV